MRNTKPWHGAARLVELVLRRLHQLRRRLVLRLRLDEGRVLLLALLRGLPASFCDFRASIAVAARSHQVQASLGQACRMLRRTLKDESTPQITDRSLTDNKKMKGAPRQPPCRGP